MKSQRKLTPVTDREEIVLKDIIEVVVKWRKYIWAKKTKIFLISVTGFLLGLSASFVVAPKYLATISFVLEDQKKSGLGNYASIAANLGLPGISNSGGGLFQEDDNIINFMKSRNMISKTLYSRYLPEGKYLIADLYVDYNNYRKSWENDRTLHNIKFHPNPEERTRLEDSIISVFCKDILKSNLIVEKPDKDEDLITITTKSKHEQFSKVFTEKLLENVTNFYTEYQTQKSVINVNILQHQVDSIRTLLNSALSGVAVSSDANPNPNPAFQRLRVPSQKRMVDVEMNKAILVELVKNLELAKINLRKETPLVQIIDQPILPLEKKRIGRFSGTAIGGILAFICGILFFSSKYYIGSVLNNTDETAQ